VDGRQNNRPENGEDTSTPKEFSKPNFSAGVFREKR